MSVSTSTSKAEELQARYHRLLSHLVPEEFVVSAELSKLLDDAICVLQAELEFQKIFEATELISVWSDAMRNETAGNMEAEEHGKNEKVSEAALFLDNIYWEMNEASLAIFERREAAKEAAAAMAECRKEIIKEISRLISEKMHENFASIAAVFDYPLRPEIASMQDSLTYELIALRKEVYGDPAWSIETALTTKMIICVESCTIGTSCPSVNTLQAITKDCRRNDPFQTELMERNLHPRSILNF